jgi:hypothetical protein
MSADNQQATSTECRRSPQRLYAELNAQSVSRLDDIVCSLRQRKVSSADAEEKPTSYEITKHRRI